MTAIDFSKELAEFLEEAQTTSSTGDFCRASVTPVYAAFAGKNTEVFSIVEGRSAAYAKAEAHLAANGVDKRPVAAFSLVRYLPFLQREKQPAWKEGSWRDLYMPFDRTVWEVVSKGWSLVNEEGVDVSPLAGRYARDLWVHIVNVPHPSFDKNDPTSWSSYNSYQNAEGETRAQVLRKIVAAFETQAELVAYMREQGVEVQVQSGGAVEELDLAKISVPESWKYPANLWEPSLKDIVAALVDGKSPASVFATWNSALSKEDFDAIVAVVMPF